MAGSLTVAAVYATLSSVQGGGLYNGYLVRRNPKRAVTHNEVPADVLWRSGVRTLDRPLVGGELRQLLDRKEEVSRALDGCTTGLGSLARCRARCCEPWHHDAIVHGDTEVE
jgi:hypothetical protein